MKSGSLSRIAEGPLRSRGEKPAQAVGRTTGEGSESVAATASKIEATPLVSEGEETAGHERRVRRRTSLDELTTQSFAPSVEAHARREPSARRQQEPDASARPEARAPQSAEGFDSSPETRSAREPAQRRHGRSAQGTTTGEEKAQPTARARASSRFTEQSESEAHDAAPRPSRCSGGSPVKNSTWKNAAPRWVRLISRFSRGSKPDIPA